MNEFGGSPEQTSERIYSQRHATKVRADKIQDTITLLVQMMHWYPAINKPLKVVATYMQRQYDEEKQRLEKLDDLIKHMQKPLL